MVERSVDERVRHLVFIHWYVRLEDGLQSYVLCGCAQRRFVCMMEKNEYQGLGGSTYKYPNDSFIIGEVV